MKIHANALYKTVKIHEHALHKSVKRRHLRLRCGVAARADKRLHLSQGGAPGTRECSCEVERPGRCGHGSLHYPGFDPGQWNRGPMALLGRSAPRRQSGYVCASGLAPVWHCDRSIALSIGSDPLTKLARPGSNASL